VSLHEPSTRRPDKKHDRGLLRSPEPTTRRIGKLSRELEKVQGEHSDLEPLPGAGKKSKAAALKAGGISVRFTGFGKLSDLAKSEQAAA